jgi:paraquat-inducible protein B
MTTESKPMFEDAIPVSMDAIARKSWLQKLLANPWWLTGICLCVAGFLWGWSWYSQGPVIVVRFREGHGLKAENRLMHRGIEVGSVEKVQLNDTLDFVDVTIRLFGTAAAIAREGSQFWIERPTLSFEGARGLETIVSGRYVAVEPGPIENNRQHAFEGLENPSTTQRSLDGLEIVLEANARHGLQNNSPVVYRGVEVGRVRSLGLSADSRWVQVRVVIQDAYRNIIRENSRFWNRSGLRLDVGLTGLKLDAESLAGIAAGGIEVATPDTPGESVKAGKRFELHAKAEDDWLTWRPRLLHGNTFVQSIEPLPRQERLTLFWQERLLGFRRNQVRSGWVMPISDGSVLIPSNLLVLPSDALEGSSRWEVAGEDWKEITERAEQAKGRRAVEVAPSVIRVKGKLPGPNIEAWPADRIGRWDGKMEHENSSNSADGSNYPLWIVGELPATWLPIERHQIEPEGKSVWRLANSLGLTEAYHGAAVIETASEAIVGVLDIRKNAARMVEVPASSEP